jgi:hypothetical protein
MRISMLRVYALALAIAATAGCGGSQGDVFIALQSDFAEYAGWPSYALGDAALAGHPPGQRVAYLSQKAPPGATHYPVGTLIVKEVRAAAAPADPTQWDLFAMVKRGGGYDEVGARDWEFFILERNAAGTPVIISRGIAPSDNGDGGAVYGGAAASGVTCNACHGALGTEQTDHILSPLLIPGAQ